MYDRHFCHPGQRRKKQFLKVVPFMSDGLEIKFYNFELV